MLWDSTLSIFSDVLNELSTILPAVLHDTAAVVVAIGSFFMENVMPSYFPFDDFILFLERFYFADLSLLTMPSNHRYGQLFFVELEVLSADFLAIVFFLSNNI
jgi:hypothetical protein